MRSFSSLKRRAPVRKPPIRFTVFTEGRNTEPEYLEALQSLFDNAIIDIATEKASGVPATIASKAIKFAKSVGLRSPRRKVTNSFESEDQVWAMFDRDTHPKVKESIDLCISNSIGVAYSNPCFELWLILHFEDFDKPVDHHKVQKHLEKVCKTYSSAARKTSACATFIGKHEEAMLRAAKMIERRKDEHADLEAPYTSVHKFIEAVQKAANSRSLAA